MTDEDAHDIAVFPLAMPLMSQSMQWHKYRTRDPGIAWLRGLFHEATRALQ